MPEIRELILGFQEIQKKNPQDSVEWIKSSNELKVLFGLAFESQTDAESKKQMHENHKRIKTPQGDFLGKSKPKERK